MTSKQQLEISLSVGECARQRGATRRVRPARARWWFERMHREVDAAVEWKPEPAPRLRQTALPILPAREAA